MKNKSKNIIKIFIGVLIFLIVSIISVIVYDRATVNNEYSINQKNLDIPVFVYHNIVSDDSEIQYDYMQTSKDTFEKQVKGLKDIGYDFITYEKLQQYKNNKIKVKKKSCIITFDDGYQGVYENAYPIAKKYNIPFTMFVVTDSVDNSGRITWDEAKEMQESGLVTIASHSMEHSDFSKMTEEEAVKDVNKSYSIIEEKLGNQPVKIFTYPYGLYTEEQLKALEEEGYVQNLTDNKINKSKSLNLYGLHRCYPLSDSIYKMVLKIHYRSIRYN